ncbi:ethanolamine utilization protein EutK [Serratia fonticola]|jgi:ethanolamine utilization protein EutK|uniref:Ethanolamine utilization protein EutK n=1 Tax=Serratia fonticola TaxID=47917 RepID=A0A559TAC7_SERFO|nr:BMC domain-containing protein [Serratia fonticola]TQI80905.1 ethanolamine utilization protein EutK [Serratia fonticola]TQI97070.1 ethanolamine utilization protein EutK [Serratia fonticola]TVZ71566.1 ethanolamine utilization protein EutK [Serratia fonticola]
MINALGLLEVRGLVAGIEATDAMLKAASVRVLSHEIMAPGWVTLVIEGDLAACRAALDAGAVVAGRTGRVISRQTLGRPDRDTEALVMHLKGGNPAPAGLAPKSLLAMIGHAAKGMTAGEVAAQMDCRLESARMALEKLYLAGLLRKRSSRYRIKKEARQVG